MNILNYWQQKNCTDILLHTQLTNTQLHLQLEVIDAFLKMFGCGTSIRIKNMNIWYDSKINFADLAFEK